MSAPHTLDTLDWQSAYRHFIYPLLSGALVMALMAGINAFMEGDASLNEVIAIAKAAGLSALVAGALRLLKRWQSSIGGTL